MMKSFLECTKSSPIKKIQKSKEKQTKIKSCCMDSVSFARGNPEKYH